MPHQISLGAEQERAGNVTASKPSAALFPDATGCLMSVYLQSQFPLKRSETGKKLLLEILAPN